MGIARFIKEIGRGSAGARALDREQACSVMSAVLDGEASDLEVGAFVLAMRMKGETLDELCGFLDAVHARCLPLQTDGPVVLIPSFNGARRLPNLTPLLAMALAQEGARVLVHGPAVDPDRVTSAQVFDTLGLPRASTSDELQRAWSRQQPAYMATEALCPPLQRLLDVRRVVGVRSSGHTVGKMIQPFADSRALRLVSYTHPEFGALMHAWAERESVDAMLLRGTEGEATADPRRQPRIESFLAGQAWPGASIAAQVGSTAPVPQLPRECDAASTAQYIQAVLSGEQSAPAPLRCQIGLVLNALAALQHPAPSAQVIA